MTRIVTVGAAQLGPIARRESRTSVVARLLALMREAKAKGCTLLAYPELALTSFFPRWFMTEEAEIDAAYGRALANRSVTQDELRRTDARARAAIRSTRRPRQKRGAAI